jgi:3-deoxy-D-manno-octulosonic-acid transferase
LGLIFYNFFLFLYKTGVLLISPWNRKAKLWIQGRKNIFDTIRADLQANQSTGLIWMHCASLGEFEQGRPVLEHLKTTHPGCRIVLTFFSASGYEIRKNYAGADYIFYLPMDSYNNAEEFIDIVKPKLVLWVKYEYWYHYLNCLKKYKIPVLLVSGIFRKDQVFFKWYGALHRKMLACFTQIFVQNEASKELLSNINFSKNVTVSGDTRFDRVIEIAEQFTSISAIDRFCRDHDVIVAGSTWEEDEEELDHFANTHPEIKFIIAPHEIDAEHLQDISKLFHHSILFTEWEQQLKDDTAEDMTVRPNVLIINNIGMLSRLYRYATIAYIGGGFGDDGVHNVLEAAVFGKPVIFGPVYEKFVEAKELLECGGAFSIENALELEEVLHVLLKSGYEQNKAGESAKAYVYLKKGAEEKIVDYILKKKLL